MASKGSKFFFVTGLIGKIYDPDSKCCSIKPQENSATLTHQSHTLYMQYSSNDAWNHCA